MILEFDESGVIGKFKASGSLEKGKEYTIDLLKKVVTNRVREAWIFGSYARNEEAPKSDLDIILIVDTKKKFHNRIDDFEDLYTIISPDIDVLVYTPEEFISGLALTDNGFWKNVKKDGVRIL